MGHNRHMRYRYRSVAVPFILPFFFNSFFFFLHDIYVIVNHKRIMSIKRSRGPDGVLGFPDAPDSSELAALLTQNQQSMPNAVDLHALTAVAGGGPTVLQLTNSTLSNVVQTTAVPTGSTGHVLTIKSGPVLGWEKIGASSLTPNQVVVTNTSSELTTVTNTLSLNNILTITSIGPPIVYAFGTAQVSGGGTGNTTAGFLYPTTSAIYNILPYNVISVSNLLSEMINPMNWFEYDGFNSVGDGYDGLVASGDSFTSLVTPGTLTIKVVDVAFPAALNGEAIPTAEVVLTIKITSFKVDYAKNAAAVNPVTTGDCSIGLFPVLSTALESVTAYRHISSTFNNIPHDVASQFDTKTILQGSTLNPSFIPANNIPVIEVFFSLEGANMGACQTTASIPLSISLTFGLTYTIADLLVPPPP